MSYSYAQLLSSPRVAQPTCEGNAALAEWNEHAAAVNTARDLLVQASDLPDRADPQAVVNALNACTAAADAMTRLYHPAQPRPRGFADVLAWMRPWFERQRLLIPDSIGDGFRTLAGALGRPNILRQDRIVIYQEAAVFATRESELAAELGGDVQRQTDAAVRAAHTAALEAARAVENGRAQPDPAAAIAAAAGPGYLVVRGPHFLPSRLRDVCTIRFETASRSQHSEWAPQARHLLRGNRRTHPGAVPVDPGRGHAARARPADRHDRRRAALAPRPPQLPYRPRLCGPLRSQPDAFPRCGAVSSGTSAVRREFLWN